MSFEAYPINSSNDSQWWPKGEFRSISILVPQKEFGMVILSDHTFPHVDIILNK